MLDRFKQFEASDSELIMLKDMLEYQNLSKSEREYVKLNGFSEDMTFKKVKKKFAKNFLLMSKEDYSILTTSLFYPDPHDHTPVRKISSVGKNKKGETLTVLKRAIDVEHFREDGHYYRQAISEMWHSIDVYMSYDENKLPKELHSVPKTLNSVNIKNEIAIILDQAFENYIDSITNSLEESNINVTSKDIIRRNLYEATITLEIDDKSYKLILSETTYQISDDHIILKSGSNNSLDRKNLIKLIKSLT